MYQWLVAALGALFAVARRPAPPPAPPPRQRPPRSPPTDNPDRPPAKKAKRDGAPSELEEKVEGFAVRKLPDKATNKCQKASVSNAALIKESAAEAGSTFKPPCKRRRTSALGQKTEESDKMPYGTSTCFNKETLTLFHKPLPRVSRNTNGTHHVKPAPVGIVTPTLPEKERAVPASVTSEVSKMGRFCCTAEEVVKQEEKEKYKQLLDLVKEKNPRRVPTIQPIVFLKGQACLMQPVVVFSPVEEQKCGGNIYPCVPLKTNIKREEDSSAEMPPSNDIIRCSTPTENTTEQGGAEKQAVAGKQKGAEISGDQIVVPRKSPAPDVKTTKLPNSNEEVDSFPSLTEDMEREIVDVFHNGEAEDIISSAFKLNIYRDDICTLQDSCWLNDEVINFYLKLVEERSKIEEYPTIHAFSTFFYPKLFAGGYSAVKRWTRNVNLFEKDVILVPIHRKLHWALAVIDIRKKAIKYLDSLGLGGNKICETLFKYLQEESREKRKLELDVSEWILHSMESHEIPQQINGSDCGVFVCAYAEYLARDEPFNFAQNHMPYFRKKIVWELMHQQLL